jgi:transposase
MRNKRKYDPEFKREAVRLVVEEGLTIREAERNLGITYGVLKGWVQKHQDHQDAAFVGHIAPQSPEAELKQLRKENDQLRRERDILKKAVAIFSTDPHRYSGS